MEQAEQKLLIVDDEESYRGQLALYLQARGFQVAAAGNGRGAIEEGIHFRPNILVTDWMLKDHIHGLHVASVLRAVDPAVKAILISGFASPDLRSKASGQVFDFLEKPFELQRLEQALRRALEAPAQPAIETMIPAAEADSSGKIVFANTAARQLFAQLRGKTNLQRLEDALPKSFAADLETLEKDWVEIPNPAKQLNTCWVKVRRLSHGGRLLVLLPVEQPIYFRTHPIVEMLLETGVPSAPSWPFSGRALVIDDEEIVRRLVMTVFERVGCLCHAAESHDLGLRLFERDPGIEFVVLDYDMPGDVVKLAAELRRIRPSVTIVGNSGVDHRADFRAAGVELFLPKPWRIEDLIGLLTRKQ